MQVEHFQQGPGAPFAHPNDDGLWQLLDEVVQMDLLFGGITLVNFMEQTTLKGQGPEGDLLWLRRWQSALNWAKGL